MFCFAIWIVLRDCSNGDVKLDGSTAMIFWNDRWSKICSHHFWDNHYGANKFCMKLGYVYGEIRKLNTPSNSDGFWIGKCLKFDRFPYCKAKCNKRRLGGTCKTGILGGPSCNAGKYDLFSVDCFGDNGKSSSC